VQIKSVHSDTILVTFNGARGDDSGGASRATRGGGFPSLASVTYAATEALAPGLKASLLVDLDLSDAAALFGEGAALPRVRRGDGSRDANAVEVSRPTMP